MSLQRLDLNLLRVFEAVLAEGNVTRAADKLYLSQSAVSHALTRLRHALKDDLFIKDARGVKPTPRAIELARPVSEALNLLETAFEQQEFDPASSTRIFRIASHDYFSTVCAADMMQHMQSVAPNISIRVRPTAGQALEQLDKQEVDFAISAFGDLPDRFACKSLLDDGYVTTMGVQHPLADKVLCIDNFVSAQHLLVSPKGDERGFIDEQLAADGLTRDIALIINQFSPAGSILSARNLLLTAPFRVIEKLSQNYPLVIKTCPIAAPKNFNQTQLVWHARYGHHPALTWFRETLTDIFTKPLSSSSMSSHLE